jgi:hypothetical protein
VTSYHCNRIGHVGSLVAQDQKSGLQGTANSEVIDGIQNTVEMPTAIQFQHL